MHEEATDRRESESMNCSRRTVLQTVAAGALVALASNRLHAETTVTMTSESNDKPYMPDNDYPYFGWEPT